MNLSTEPSLPIALGTTPEQVAQGCYEYEFIEDDFGLELEGFIDIRDIEPEDEGRKVICRFEENRCVAITMAYLDVPITDTFLGLDLNSGGEAEQKFLAALKEKGIEAISQFDGIVLPNDFVTLELGESITWWDRDYWGRDGFIEEAVAL